MSVTLGILLPKQKKKKLKFPDRIADLCNEANIEITELDVESDDFNKQGPFDVLFHKVTDFFNECSNDEAKRRIEKVKQFAANFPNMHIIDEFEASEKMTDRKYQTEVLKCCELTLDGIKVFVPKIIEISSNSSLEAVREIITSNNMKFPVLAKPLVASLADGSHKMTLIFSEENLKDLPIPCLLQEFCNHGGILYKVYVVGDRFNMCQRPSIKDIDCSTNKSLIFDTRNVSKTGKAFIPDLHEHDPNLRKWLSCDDNPDMLNRTVVEELCKRLRTKTNLKLFGFDVLIEKGSSNYAIIDMNQLPGYGGINESYFPKHLVELILKEAKK